MWWKMNFVLDTNILRGYFDELDGGISAEAIFAAKEEGQLFYSIASEMECLQYKQNRIKNTDDVEIIRKLAYNLGIKLLDCPPLSQDKALEIIEKFKLNLGKSFIFDCLIASSALMLDAIFITNDKNWTIIGRNIGLKVRNASEVSKGLY